jgi:hypothetical protein
VSGFRNIREYVDAYESGQTFFTMVRKGRQTAAMSSTSVWFDWTTMAGYPTANFYASAPLVAAVMDNGIRVPVPSVSPKSQFLKSLALCMDGNNGSTVYGNSLTHRLLDYLLYYPFVDATAVGEEQLMDNSVTLPRYTDGAGVQMMLVGQSAIAGGAGLTGTITYINQDGVQKTTPAFAVGASAYSGILVASTLSTGAAGLPFVQLALRDSGVRSVVSATFSADAGGILAIVLVKQLHMDATTDASSLLTTNTQRVGSFAKTEFVIEKQPIKIEDGAFLGFISWIQNDSRSTQLTAAIETIWN